MTEARGAAPAWRVPAVMVAAALVGAAVYLPGRLEYSNIDEYVPRTFGGAFFTTLRDAVVGDAGGGRCRPLYWLVSGVLGIASGSSATLFVAARLAFLAAQVALQIALGLRLGAPLLLSALLSLAVAWCRPAHAIWTPGGPAEAIGNPVALAATLLVLRAKDLRGVLLAAAVGLAAAFTKETYGAWTGAALGAWAVAELLRGRRGAATWVAVGGAVAQLVPAAIATVSVRVFATSYLAYAVQGMRAPAGTVAWVALDQALTCVLVGVPALALLGWRLARTRPVEWPVEDLVTVAVVVGVAGLTFAVGMTIPRYHLPVATALAVVAARAARPLSAPPRRRAALLATAGLLVAVAPGAPQAYVSGAAARAVRSADGRVRAMMREALERYGAVRVRWWPDQVETPVGALTHLRVDGVKGKIELKPCVAPPPAQAAMLGEIFAKYSEAVDGPAPVLVSTYCPGYNRFVPVAEACELVLPGLRSLTPRYICRPVQDLALFAYVP